MSSSFWSGRSVAVSAMARMPARSACSLALSVIEGAGVQRIDQGQELPAVGGALLCRSPSKRLSISVIVIDTAYPATTGPAYDVGGGAREHASAGNAVGEQHLSLFSDAAPHLRARQAVL